MEIKEVLVEIKEFLEDKHNAHKVHANAFYFTGKSILLEKIDKILNEKEIK